MPRIDYRSTKERALKSENTPLATAAVSLLADVTEWRDFEKHRKGK